MKQFISFTFVSLIIFSTSCGILKSASEKFSYNLSGKWELVDVQKLPNYNSSVSAKEINDIIDAGYVLTIIVDEFGNYIKMMNSEKETGKTVISEDAKTVSFGTDKYIIQTY